MGRGTLNTWTTEIQGYIILQPLCASVFEGFLTGFQIERGTIDSVNERGTGRGAKIQPRFCLFIKFVSTMIKGQSAVWTQVS